MAITYSLKVTQMDCLPEVEGQTNVVFRVHWAYTGTDGANNAGFGGTTDLTYTPGNPFTPFDQVTEEQAAEWVLGMWTPEYKADIEAILTEQLATSAPPLPWGTTPAEPVVA